MGETNFFFHNFQLFGHHVNVPFCNVGECFVFSCCRCRSCQSFSITFLPQHLAYTHTFHFHFVQPLVIFVYSLIECRFAAKFIVLYVCTCHENEKRRKQNEINGIVIFSKSDGAEALANKSMTQRKMLLFFLSNTFTRVNTKSNIFRHIFLFPRLIMCFIVIA